MLNNTYCKICALQIQKHLVTHVNRVIQHVNYGGQTKERTWHALYDPWSEPTPCLEAHICSLNHTNTSSTNTTA